MWPTLEFQSQVQDKRHWPVSFTCSPCFKGWIRKSVDHCYRLYRHDINRFQELGLLASKSSAREALCNELTVVKQAFARSDEVLQIDRRRIDTLAKKSTQAFEIGKDLAECTEHVLEQIKNKEAINSARIEEAKRKAHLCLLETNELASHQEENSALLERIEKKRDIGRIVSLWKPHLRLWISGHLTNMPRFTIAPSMSLEPISSPSLSLE